MPKLVDHDARRERIVDATWRIIARGGFESATMREVAAEAGFAHGALARYFPSKNALLEAAFRRAHTSINATLEPELAALRGLAKLRRFLLELLPITEEGRHSARVVVAFWEHAIEHPEHWASNRENADQWREFMGRCLAEAVDDDEIPAPDDPVAVVDELFAVFWGVQLMSLLLPEHTAPARQLAMIDDFLARLRLGA